MTGKRRIVKEEGEEYLHNAVWQVVNQMINTAEANPGETLNFYLIAMVFASHCIEGYLNYAGDKIAPDLWSEEKKNFGGKGIEAKVKTLCHRCQIDNLAKGRRPYSTVLELKNLRDLIAHPKIFKTLRKTKISAWNSPKFSPSDYLKTLVSQKKALRARDDMKSLADMIHGAALQHFPETGLESEALGYAKGWYTIEFREE